VVFDRTFFQINPRRFGTDEDYLNAFFEVVLPGGYGAEEDYLKVKWGL
jgi:hypothetical protein